MRGRRRSIASGEFDPPEVKLRRLRARRPRSGASRRLAELPRWDGLLRYRDDPVPWEDSETHREAWQALRDKARGYGWPGSQHDPNDPPAVSADIRAHPKGPYGGPRHFGYFID